MKYHTTTWTSPLRFYQLRIGVPDLNIPAAAQPVIPPEETLAFVRKLRELDAAFAPYCRRLEEALGIPPSERSETP